MENPCKGCQYAFRYEGNKRVKWSPRSMECHKCEKHAAYLKYREKFRTYRKGGQIKTMAEFEKYSQDGFIYQGNKIQPIGWLESMQYRTLKNMVSWGMMYEAVKKEKQA